MTLTELAREAEKVSGKKFTIYTLSQNLVNSSMKYDEQNFWRKYSDTELNLKK